ncbi:hypothetical protein BDN71DRAFT_1442355 [Pleurotus eryngii]|uniref:Uncharacterized protein n=1 Tax=Pleurotus eryngii TaxID=5323 RepID=A0A9P6A5C8_PLEER|nr:hypothetical protein BDN71DRAFT_1442355 [Pleurotus eryngii]
MMYQLFFAATLAVAGANASALPSSPPTVCLKACFPSNHVCAEGQFLRAPYNGSQCFACCRTPPTPPPPSQVCLRACFPKDHVCQEGQYLKAPANEGGCFACCSL